MAYRTLADKGPVSPEAASGAVVPGLQLAYEGGPGSGFEAQHRTGRVLAVTDRDDGPRP